MSDEEVVRAMKSILNKLTVEKFDSLSQQLLHCGIRSTAHLELLIDEIFQKATTQHHFIDMYADLCALLAQQSIIGEPKALKKILLNCCQASFEKHLAPPAGLAELSDGDRETAELMYKMRMLGNIRFVGALFVRKMLASKVMIAIMEELLQDPTPEALESLAAFLTVVGPTFDVPDWTYSAALNAVFAQVEKLAKKTKVPKRVRCLIRDMLDLRALGWQDKKPKKIEGPLKLQEVAAKAAMENGYASPTSGNEWETVGGSRSGRSTSLTCISPTSSVKSEVSEKTTRMFAKAREATSSPKVEVPHKKKTALFDQEECRREISAALAELRVSHDVADATARIAGTAVPASHQPAEFIKIISQLVEEGSEVVRKNGFDLVARLFLESHWEAASANESVRMFVEEICPDLKYDVPTLAHILRDELYPALTTLTKKKVLELEQHNVLLNV
jgi:hypothetical protein